MAAEMAISTWILRFAGNGGPQESLRSSGVFGNHSWGVNKKKGMAKETSILTEVRDPKEL